MCVAIDDGCSPQIERARLNGMRASECLRTYIGPHLQATYIHYTFTITRTTAINTAIPWILFYACNVLVCRRVLPPRVAEIYGVRSAHGAKVGGDDGAGADGKKASSVSIERKRRCRRCRRHRPDGRPGSLHPGHRQHQHQHHHCRPHRHRKHALFVDCR